jgi:hypothetical protein
MRLRVEKIVASVAAHDSPPRNARWSEGNRSELTGRATDRLMGKTGALLPP